MQILQESWDKAGTLRYFLAKRIEPAFPPSRVLDKTRILRYFLVKLIEPAFPPLLGSTEVLTVPQARSHSLCVGGGLNERGRSEKQ
jgi:hypothetical protein